MSFEKDGFLSKDNDNFILSANDKYKSTFNYCRELNEFAQTLMSRFNVRNKMINELIIGASYTRLLSSFQGSIIMAERGMMNEMKVLSRNFSEMVFLICAISNNEENARLFLLDDEIQRKKLLNKYKSLDSDLINHNLLPEVQKVINNIDSKNIKHISTEYLSIEAKLHDHYKTYYAILSLSVHPSSRELQTIFTFDDDNKITSINYGANDTDTEKILLSNCSYLLISLNHIKNVFFLKIDENIKELNNKFIEIWSEKFK